MNANVISKENNLVKFTFQATPEVLEEGMKYAYDKARKNISIPGFRKGKAPRKIIEAQYGVGIFYDDAINFVLNKEYEGVIKELGLDVVSRPEVDVKEIGKDKGVTFEIGVYVKPDVTLGQYKGLEVEKQNVEVTAEDVDAEIKKVQEQNSRMVTITDRPAAMGDVVTISYLGTVDGVAFDGGQSDAYDLTLGSKTFIDTFEDQIVGHNTGDKFDVNVKFPEEYHAEELKGKDAVFAVEVKEIKFKELPEANDELAQDVSDFDTLDEYKASISEKLKADKEARAKQIMSDSLLDKAVENATMDVPECMYENKLEQLLSDFEQNIGRSGLTLDLYCTYIGTTRDGLREQFKDTAKKSVDARLVLEAIASVENLTLSKEEVDEEIGKLGESWGLTAERMLEIFREEDRKNIEEDLLVRKAMTFVEDNAVEVEPKAE